MRTLKIALSLMFVIALAGCSTVTVVTDFDKTVDFSRYETYSFLGWQDDSGRLLNDMGKERVRKAFRAEFDARELKWVEADGDMEISLFLVVDSKTSTTAYTDYYSGGGYGGYHRYGGGWGHGFATTTYSEYDYMDGTLVMDVFDGESKDQIWQGVMKGTINENPAKRDKTTPANIKKLMSKFPVEPLK